MYGLFHRYYDHYEWSDLKAVSTTRKALRQLHESWKGKIPLIKNTEYESYKEYEQSHYAIIKVRLVKEK